MALGTGCYSVGGDGGYGVGGLGLRERVDSEERGGVVEGRGAEDGCGWTLYMLLRYEQSTKSEELSGRVSLEPPSLVITASSIYCL